jgi:hypothetical protein
MLPTRFHLFFGELFLNGHDGFASIPFRANLSIESKERMQQDGRQWLGSTPGFHTEIGTLWGTNVLSIRKLYGSKVEPYIVNKITGMSGGEYWKVPIVITDDLTKVDQGEYRVKWEE